MRHMISILDKFMCCILKFFYADGAAGAYEQKAQAGFEGFSFHFYFAPFLFYFLLGGFKFF